MMFTSPPSRTHVPDLRIETDMREWPLRDERPNDEELGLPRVVPEDLERHGESRNGNSEKPSE